MTFSRHEQNVTTGLCEEIDQVAYKNIDMDVLVLDASEDAPDGYHQFDPNDKADVEDME
jgi:hypothetical protein